MTICISAIGKNEINGEEFIVFATDHMVTFGNKEMSNEFEHNIKKYKELGLTNKSVAMLSGTTLLFEELLKETEKLEGYDNIRDKIYNNFKDIKKRAINNQLLEPFALSEKDLKEFLIRPVENPVTRTILESIMKHNLNTSILLIGFKEKKAQIYEINEYEKISVRDIHFHTIGSGCFQASNSLFIQKHCREDNLKKTIYNVYKAKRNAKIAKGVGQDTEILVCSENKIISISDDDLKELKLIYDKELTFGQEQIIQKDLKSLNAFMESKEVVEQNV